MGDSDASMDGKGVDAGVEAYDALSSGQLLDDRYELVARIGEGSFGEVWKAIDRRLGLTVAVKLAKDGASVDRFEQEVALLSNLQHPGVVVLRDRWAASSPRARPFFVMEYCDSTLKKRLEPGRLALDEVRAIFLAVCHAAAFVHSKGMIHRDLKPSNILLIAGDKRFIPKLADLGVARAAPARDSTATRGVGTELYKSPEVGVGKKPESASDVFALAVIVVEALTGQPTPEDDLAWWQFVTQHVTSAEPGDASVAVVKRLRTLLGPSLSDAAVDVVARALSPAARDRPTALELGETFDRATRIEAVVGQKLRSRFPMVVAASNTAGYLLATVPAVFIDPTLTTRKGFHARTYAHAWLIAPLSVSVFVATLYVFRFDPRKYRWLALVPLLLAGAASVPILAFGGEVPHARLTSSIAIWTAITGVWLGAHYALNSPHAIRSPLNRQDEGRLFVLLLGCFAIIVVLTIPILSFQRQVVTDLAVDPGEVARLQSLAYLDYALWALFWLAGPTREVAIAWRRVGPPSRDGG